jgi:hypothetical protein
MTTFTAPRDGTAEARLELTRGGTHITVHSAELDDLCRAEFEGTEPKTNAEGGRVRIDYPRFSAAELLRHPAHTADIELTQAVPWSLEFDGGLGDSSIDLSGLELRAFEIAGGAGDVRVVLPEPHGVVPVRIRGGASKVTIVHPEGAAATLRIGGGASNVDFDGQSIGASRGETRLQSGNAEAADRYEIEIGGGASNVTVGT